MLSGPAAHSRGRAFSRAALLAAPALLLLGSLDARAAAAPPAPAVQFYDGSFECYAGPLALQLPDTYAQLLHLGPVVATRDGRVQVQKGLTTTERSIDFGGLAITVHLFSGDPEHYEVVRVQMQSARWKLSPLRVGEPASDALRQRDWPPMPREGGWEVQSDNARLIVTVKAGRIAAIDYVCDAAP